VGLSHLDKQRRETLVEANLGGEGVGRPVREELPEEDQTELLLRKLLGEAEDDIVLQVELLDNPQRTRRELKLCVG